MRSLFCNAAIATLCATMVVQAQASRIHHGPSARRQSNHHYRLKHSAHKVRGQRQIDQQRATAIQAALIREHYLTGEPTGQWDSATEAAMRKMQADNGWQTKITPDSRALIKLGLGPDHSTDLSVATAGSASASTGSALAVSGTQNR